MNISKKTLKIGTAATWAAVLLGVSAFVEAEQNTNLDWELMWIIVGGFIIQTILIGSYTKKDRNE